MRLTTTGLGVTGSASVLLTQQTSGWAAATIENPDLIDAGGAYYLFFSGGHWNGKTYAEGYVTCSGATSCNNTVQSSTEILDDTTSVPYGPGGASLFTATTGTWLIAYHGWNKPCTTYATLFGSCGASRQLYVSLTSGLTPTSMPTITSFTASPSSLTTAGGTVTFSVISPHMTNYSINSSPHLTGLPVETPTVHIPANTTGSSITYTFTVTTSNDVGIETKTTSVTEAADPPAPAEALNPDSGYAPTIFFDGPNNTVINDWYVPSGPTWGSTTLPGSTYSVPAAALNPNTAYAPTVFFEGQNNTVTNDWYVPSIPTWGSTQVNASGAPTEQRVAVISGGAALVKEGSLTSSWVEEATTGVTAIALSGTRIGELFSSGQFDAKNGLYSSWTEEATSGVKAIALSGTLIGELFSGGQFDVKSGLYSSWTEEMSSKGTAIALSGT
jgi:hypothetical protein